MHWRTTRSRGTSWPSWHEPRHRAAAYLDRRAVAQSDRRSSARVRENSERLAGVRCAMASARAHRCGDPSARGLVSRAADSPYPGRDTRARWAHAAAARRGAGRGRGGLRRNLRSSGQAARDGRLVTRAWSVATGRARRQAVRPRQCRRRILRVQCAERSRRLERTRCAAAALLAADRSIGGKRQHPLAGAPRSAF